MAAKLFIQFKLYFQNFPLLKWARIRPAEKSNFMKIHTNSILRDIYLTRSHSSFDKNCLPNILYLSSTVYTETSPLPSKLITQF